MGTKEFFPYPNVSLEAKRSSLKSLERELVELEKQKGSLHDFLERGVYTVEVYLERSQLLAHRHNAVKEAIETMKHELRNDEDRENALVNLIPKVQSVLELYRKTDDPASKNKPLRDCKIVCVNSQT
ncbi:hypothetical protein N0M98_22375 [Paenibacillus doosanensis]|uniref:hypothetical protein n=1 Tax=Paenibacillus doosanensis TaxID=1229154 RepID=UPI00217F35B2|nr:hypothetical protein [Paenibacillus doosanensis]MCS7462875.1 hypothetical protein [Paenibacillus doosanensis]